MAEAFDTDVLIVGAGPAGLSVACQLARNGLRFRIVDRQAGPPRASRGKGVQPRTQEILEDLGALPDFLAASGGYPPLRIFNGDDIVGERPFAETAAVTPDIPYPNLRMAPQWRTDEILRATLERHGAQVEGGLELLDFAQDKDGVTAKLSGDSGPQTVRARYLVGTDGGRSLVRRQLDIGFPGETLSTPRFLFGDIHVEGLARDAWARWPTPYGDAGLCPLPHVDVFQLMIPLADGEEPELTEAAAVELFLARTGVTKLRLYNPTWLSIFTPNLRLASAYRVGRVFIAGDAAHVHPPTGAQGLNTSIQDGYNLGWKLALVVAGDADEALLETYEAERRPVGASILAISKAISGQGGAMTGKPRGRQTQQLDIGYRDSRLSVDGGDTDRPLAAGDRAPDAPLAVGGRLFEALRGPSFTLLRFGDLPLDVPSRPAVRTLDLALESEVARTFGIDRPSAVLIRPDNYIGLFAPGAARDAVTRYLAVALGRAVAGG